MVRQINTPSVARIVVWALLAAVAVAVAVAVGFGVRLGRSSSCACSLVSFTRLQHHRVVPGSVPQQVLQLCFVDGKKKTWNSDSSQYRVTLHACMYSPRYCSLVVGPVTTAAANPCSASVGVAVDAAVCFVR